jgi:hypothetical protein
MRMEATMRGLVSTTSSRSSSGSRDLQITRELMEPWQRELAALSAMHVIGYAISAILFTTWGIASVYRLFVGENFRVSICQPPPFRLDFTD